MNMHDYTDQLLDKINLVARRRNPSCTVLDETPLLDSGLLDSLGFAELLQFMEDDLNMSVPDHLLSAEHFRTVKVIVETFVTLEATE